MNMEIKLEVLASTCIKQRKPWPRITWLGQEKEAVYLLDDKNINEINLLSGQTKKKIPQLYPLLKNVYSLSTSRNGAWLAGILQTGELLLWNKDHDILKIVPGIEESKKVVTAAEECSVRLHLDVSGDGSKVLLATSNASVFLWENMEFGNAQLKNSLMGGWSQIIPAASVIVPSVEEKETSVSSAFIKNEMLGDCCLCCFVFCSENNLILTFLEIKWQESDASLCRIQWTQQTCCLHNLSPCCEAMKSRGALLSTFSSDGLVLAIAINQKNLQATQILFMSTVNFVTASGTLKGCGSKNQKIPSKLIRSYWIADMNWTPDSLFLACMLKRGSLILMNCLGELLTLVTYGCSVEFGPAEFIPLLPLITYRPQNFLSHNVNPCHDSSASEEDIMRQRFSVTSHPYLPYLIASDGYIVTVLRFSDTFSSSAYMRSLLLDSAQRLEKLHHTSIASKSKTKRLRLQSLSSLRASLLNHHPDRISFFSAVPKFLQEEENITELSGEVAYLQDYHEDSDEDKLIQNHSFIFWNQKANTLSDEGQLEFASMFNTVHAVDGTEKKDDIFLELDSIQKNLITAWRIGISRNVQERDALLYSTIRCITHFFNILQYTKFNFAHMDNPTINCPWIQCILNCFQQFLSVLSWEGKGRQTLGHLMKLTLQTLKLILTDQRDQLFPSNLLGGFSLLKMVTFCLNGQNSPQYETLPAVDVYNEVLLDSVAVPIFQTVDWSSRCNFSAVDSMLKLPPPVINWTENSGKRIVVMWRLLYEHVVQWWTELNKKIQNSTNEVTEIQISYEIPMIKALASHIQAVIQSSGEGLEQILKLNSVAGEEQFLMGSYKESVDAWEIALQETKQKGGKRMPFLQTRYYLAILYCHLYHYNLSEAQGLCDHLVSVLLKRTQISVREKDDMPEAEGMFKDVHTEAALAVIQSLARFMAAYFTNEPLFVLPPHNVDVLPPLHIRPERYPRIVPLQHATVTNAVRLWNLSCIWTVEYTFDLLLVGGLIPEAVWLAHKLGDWKMAVSVGVIYNFYYQRNSDFLRLQKTELYLPLDLMPTRIFQEKLQSILGHPASNESANEDHRYKHLTDPIEEEDANMLFGSMEEILKVAVMAEADILSETFQLLMDSAKDLSRKFYGLVPDGLYLPAPPLYCPQPSFSSEDVDLLLRMERDCRQKVSGVIQRILLLLRAAHCSFPAAQWYIMQLKQARKIMQKIRMKSALPSLSALPENLLNYSRCCKVLFKPPSSGDHGLDDVSCKVIGCFRELCALCWMLHVRERLSDTCRRYQITRENQKNEQENKTEFDACRVERSLNALEWACRMLPFARFMNVEELIQDIILSLIGELPPIRQVAEILVKAFPNSEDVRVPLRDKYNALHQRLRYCVVKGHNSEEIMSVVMQDAHKRNVKVLKRVVKNIGSNQRNIWEPFEEEIQDPETYCCDRLSLGTTLSRSTISDMGSYRVYNDTEAPNSLSETWLKEEGTPVSSQMQRGCKDILGSEQVTECSRTAEKEGKHNKKEKNKSFPTHHILPLVGEWEFERDDDEYMKFLDLFLTYVLERDLINHRDAVIPFLASFSALLRKHELNSLLFDIHTTLKRRQNRTKGQSIFIAGSCYTLVFEPSGSKPTPLDAENKTASKKQTRSDPSICDSMIKGSAKSGLFGLRHQPIYSAQNSSKGNIPTPVLTQYLSEQASSFHQAAPVHKYICKAVEVNDTVRREEVTPEMTFKYSDIARLLEWMIRWSDRKMFYGPVATQPFQECPPMIHVKTSASAILTSLWLLEHYYSESEGQSIYLQKSQKQYVSAYSSSITTKLDENSRTDTGSPPSVGFWDRHVAGEPAGSLPRILYENQPRKNEKQSEKKENNSKDHSVTCDVTIGEIDLEEGLREKWEESKADDVNVTSENEDCCEDSLAVSRTPTISVSIKSVHQKPEPYLPESEFECPKQDPLIKILETNFSKLSCAESETAGSNVSHSVYAEVKAEIPSVKISGSDDQHPFTVGTSAVSEHPVGKKEEGEREHTVAQPPNVSDAVRQMLQDEMFKLVQLQQINFMSLMQIVGSSFANLSNVSQQMPQPQSFQLGASPASNVREANVDTSHPNLTAGGFPVKQTPMLENSKGVNKNSPGSQEKSRLFEQTHNGNILESVHVSDSSPLPESQSMGARPLPLFQSLLQQVPCRSLPLLTAPLNSEKKPKLIPLAKPLSNANGLPLLKLKQEYQFQPLNISLPNAYKGLPGALPYRKEAWAPPPLLKNPPGIPTPEHTDVTSEQLHLNKHDNEDVRQAPNQASRWAETVKHLHLGDYEKKDNWATSHRSQEHLKPEKPLVDNEIPFPKPFETCAKIPLLNLKQRPKFQHPSAKISVKITEESKDTRDPFLQAGIPLLHMDLPPLIKFQTPKLIPLQSLITFEQSHRIVQGRRFGHEDHPGTIQLLKTNYKPQEMKQDKNNKKRQKRRAEKKIKEKEEQKNTVDNLGLDDTRVSSDTVKQTQENEAKFNYVFLHGDSFLDPEAVTTSAGLHYLASVRRKTTNLQDASTNTDAVPKSHQNVQTFSEEIGSEADKNQSVTSVSASVTELLPSSIPQPPDLYLNLRFPTEAKEMPLPSTLSDTTSDLAGQNYIQVVDIEDSDCLKNLPDISMSAVFPTSAKLHNMAASVTNAIPPEEFKKEGESHQTEFHHVTPETVETEILTDNLPLNLLHDDSSINSSAGLLARKISKEHFSAKLQEMDKQLLALQNVAERMEEEFRNTRLLVETVEDVNMVADSGLDEVSFFAPSVQVSKDERRHYSPHMIVENLAEEQESLEAETPETSYIPLQTPSVSSPISAANLGVKKSTSDIKFSSEGLDESFSRDPLQISGLSGVSDIIADLIMDHHASASELGLTETQAKKIASMSNVQNRHSRKTEKDKKELQTWMKRKRRERLAEYLQTRDEQRAKEHNPFHLRKRSLHRITGREIKLQQKKKDERDKALQLEHHNIRVSEALSLMHELLSDTRQLPSSEHELLPPSKSSQDGFKRQNIAPGGGSYSGSYQATTNKSVPKASLRQTRSFSSLSGDVSPRKGRMSQAPYRRVTSESYQSGIWWKSKTNQKQQPKSRVDSRLRDSGPSRMLVSQGRPRISDAATQADEESEEDTLSVWTVPDEIQRILYGSSNLHLQESASHEDNCCIASPSILDNVSESTSSILSKLDWNAIEAMVAEVEER